VKAPKLDKYQRLVLGPPARRRHLTVLRGEPEPVRQPDEVPNVRREVTILVGILLVAAVGFEVLAWWVSR
jgi:hypothetical protein